MNAFQKSKLYRMFRLLDEKELDDFEKWLRSPWCNVNRKLILLLKILRKATLRKQLLSKEIIFKKLYPGNSYNASLINNQLSELSLQMEDFLKHQRLRKEQSIAQFFLAEEYLERQQKDWFFKKTDALINEKKRKAVLSSADYYWLNLLNKKIYRNISALEKQKVNSDYFNAAVNYLDKYYALEKVRFLSEQQERYRIIRTAGEEIKHEAFIEYFNGMELPEAVEIYLEFFDEKQSFQSRKARFIRKLPRIDFEDRKIILLLLINEAARMWVKGKHQSLKQALDLYKLGLENNLLIHNSRMTATTFANIVTIAYNLKDVEFAEYFKKQYAIYLQENEQEDALNWADAYFAYHIRRPEDWKALEIKLSQWRSGLNSFSIRAKVLLIQMRFDHFVENKNKDYQLIDFSLAFEKQISRDQNFSRKRLQSIKRFVQFVRKLYKLASHPDFSTEQMNGMEKALLSDGDIRAREWLLQKIEQLK